VLERAGVDVGFHTDDYITDSRLFLRMGAYAVRTGMSREKALEGLTLAGARMLGFEDRIGSLEQGKDADFVLLSGDPFSVYTRVLETWVEGDKVFDLDDPDDRAVADGAYGVITPSSVAQHFHGYGEGH
jgi:imidazolonepropionase-like amidohydrolase